MADLQSLLPRIVDYVKQIPLINLPGWDPRAPYTLQPLAQGEYNLNYILEQPGSPKRRWVVRVNIGSQIPDNERPMAQIVYEFKALRLLAETGVTPVPYLVDETPNGLDYGLLIMEYLPGEPLDYRRDLDDAARLFARIHNHPIDPANNHLIREESPLSMTYDECARLLPVYLDSELAAHDLRVYLSEVLAWADMARHRERYFVEDPLPCVINTEVNSGNFIARRGANRNAGHGAGTLHLVDWEKPLWGDPSQDLSHFCAPMTTLWKTEFRMSAAEKAAFLETYRQTTTNEHLADTIVERVRLRDPFNYLRGISWSAMAWVAYQTGEHAVRNEDTFRKITSYLDLDFQREMFDPYLSGG